MYLLYSCIILMLLSSVALITVPFITNYSLFSLKSSVIIIFIILFSLGLYQFTGNHLALKEWLTEGKQHYQLQKQIQQLGGVASIIQKIQQKLAKNPYDAKGWFILGKLYLANQQYPEAKKALSKALRLDPNNLQIKQAYDMAMLHRLH